MKIPDTAMDDNQAFSFPFDSDLDFSFTSCASNTSTERTFASSSARSSSSVSISDRPFLDRRSHPHRRSDPRWSAVEAASRLSPDGCLHLRDLRLLRHVGSGNLGRVYLCQLRDAPQEEDDAPAFALKVVDRNALTEKKLSHVQTEAHVLSTFDHPFLPTLYARLEASHYSCLLMDYCSGGDLHALLSRQPGNRLPLPSVRFYSAEVLVVLEYLHTMGVVYRDLKPENVLLRDDGHVMLSDFDLCFRADVGPTLSRVGPTRCRSSLRNGCFCTGSGDMDGGDEEMEFVAEPTGAFSKACVGTHEYLAPELVDGGGHGSGVDWWAFGVFVYEMMYGRTPFKGGSKDVTLRNIATGKGVRFPELAGADVAMEAKARDLVEKLLVRDPRRRLGCARGAAEVKRHPFFEGIHWPLIRCYRPPGVHGAPPDRHVGSRRGSWKGYFGDRSFKLGLNRKSNDRKWA